MPENIEIAIFVFGAILVLIAIVGGNFKLFGAHIAPTISDPFLRFVAFALGTALLTLAIFLPEHPQNLLPPKSPNPLPNPSPPKTFPLPKTSDISGYWQGVISQQLINGTVSAYTYELNLSQDGNSIDGTARIQIPPPYGYYVVMKIRGTLSDDVFNFDDGLITNNMAPPGWLWCRKSVKLFYDQSNDGLQGTWSQIGCGSGEINLSRR